MKILMTARGEGKTAACVAYLRQYPTCIMLVATERIAQEVRRNLTFNESHLTERIQSWEWFANSPNRRRMRVTGLIIDNADMILEQMFECPIEAISMTWPEAVAKPSPRPRGKSFLSGSWKWP